MLQPTTSQMADEFTVATMEMSRRNQVARIPTPPARLQAAWVALGQEAEFTPATSRMLTTILLDSRIWDAQHAMQVAETFARLVLPFAVNVNTGDQTEKIVGSAHKATAMTLLATLSGREDLTEESILHLFRSHLGRLDELGVDVLQGQGQQFEARLLFLLSHEALSMSGVGTAWRLFTQRSGQYSRFQWMLRGRVSRNLNTPAAVTARLVDAAGLAEVAFLEQLFRQQVARDYPDLAGLPTDLLVDVAAGQPLPADWFVDVFPLPGPVTILEPPLT